NSCGGTEIWVDIGALLETLLARAACPPTITSVATALRGRAQSILFDPYHLRPAADHLVALHRLQRAMHRILVGRIGDQNDRHRCGLAGGWRDANPVGMTLRYRFDGNVLLGEARCDRRRTGGVIARHQ